MVKTKKDLKKVAEEQLSSVSNLFSLLSHPARIKILWLLKQKALSVHEIQEKLKLSQSNVSQHLSVLRAYKLVSEERNGKEVYYRLLSSRNVSKVLKSACHLIAYQLTANSEIFSSAELLSFWL